MKKTTLKLLSLCLILVMVLSIFAGCGAKDPAVSSAEASAPAESTVEAAPAPESAPAEDAASVEEEASVVPEEEAIELPEPGAEFPLVEDGSVDISVWFASPPFASMMGDYAECDTWDFFINLSEMTGLNFSFTYGSFLTAADDFSLMVASGDFTDVISGNRYTAGVDAAIEDEVYLALNDLIEEYSPYYYQQLQRPEIKKDAYTEKGNVGLYYALYDADGMVNSGIGINETLLADWDKDLPETYDDYTQFFAYLQNKGVKYPLMQTPFHQITASGYNNIQDWVVVDGTVQYGLVTDQSKDYYEIMVDWYKNGYLMQDYFTTDFYDNQNGVYASLIDCTGGVSFANVDAFSAYPEANLTGLNIMVQNKGDQVHTYSKEKAITADYGWAISTACPEDEQILLAKALDYLYTEPGSVMVTWGTENVSFEYDENGTPQYIETIFTEFPITMCGYLKYATMSEVGLSDIRKVYYGYDEKQIATCEFWDIAQKDDYLYPATSLNEEEQEIISKYFAEAETYIEEYVNKVIYGAESLDTWDTFIQTLKSDFNFDEVVAAKQSSYDRYANK